MKAHISKDFFEFACVKFGGDVVSSDGHFVQRSGTVWIILLKCLIRNISNLEQWFMGKCRLNDMFRHFA